MHLVDCEVSETALRWDLRRLASAGTAVAEPTNMKLFSIAILLICELASNASADDSARDEPTSLPQWRIAVRANAYQPELAKADQAPFLTSFGGLGGLLVSFDVQRRMAYSKRFGTATAGASIGMLYMREDARTARDMFRLIPITAAVGWRATQLADLLRFPLVPYLNIGAGYSRWAALDFDAQLFGGVTRFHHGEQWHLDGAIGISLRAEDIDPDSARSMRESGIDHAGFFLELRTTTGQFGDTTLGGGIEFEM